MANYNINSRLYNGKGENNISNSNIINKSNIYKFSSFTGIMFFLLVLVNYSLSHGSENEVFVFPRHNYPNKATKFINLNWAKNKKAHATRQRPPALVLEVVEGNINDKFKIANVRCKIEDNKIVQLDNIISNIDYLGFRKKKYAIFDIITKKEINGHIFFSDNIYVYSSDINSIDINGKTDCRGIFTSKNNSLSQVKVIACDTYNVIDMRYMFGNCSSLTNLDLSNFNTNNVTNMRRMFSGCSSLTSLNISSFNTNNVTNMRSMFYNCSKLTVLDLSNFNTKNVTNMSFMFYDCSSLKTLNLSNFNTSNVTYMFCMFAGCSSLKTLNLSNFNTDNVTNMVGMFDNCRSLKELDLSKFNTTNVTDMRWMFWGCRSLKELNISNFNTDNVGDVNKMFKYCFFKDFFKAGDTATLICKASTIQNIIDYGDSHLIITNKNNDEINNTLNNNQGKVYKCSVERNVKEINPKVTSVEEYKLKNIQSDGKIDGKQIVNVNFAKANLVKYVPIVGNEYDKQMIQDSFMASITPIGQTHLSAYVEVKDNGTVKLRCFIHCKDANSIKDGQYYYGLFAGSAATKIEILSCGSEIENMNSMFSGCSSLTELDLSNFNTNNVTNMQFMFNRCSGLTKIIFSDNLKTNTVTNMRGMFYNCSSLTELDLSKFNTNNVKYMETMFYNCFQNKATLICKESTLKNITDNGNRSYLIISGKEKDGVINNTLNKNPKQVYTCSVKREKSESRPQITEVEEYKQQQYNAKLHK